VFFGRDAAIVRGMDRLRDMAGEGRERLFVILGASGSGKSSFLRAGLWPRLARDDRSFFTLPIIRPGAAVLTGDGGLAMALTAAFTTLNVPRPLEVLRDQLGAGQLATLLAELAERARHRLGTEDGATAAAPALVLAIDQAEELFQPEGAEEARHLLEQLALLLDPPPGTTPPRLLVLATVRSDRYEQLQATPAWAAVQTHLFSLPPLPVAEYKSVIEGPARRVVEAGGRLTLEPALVEQLIRDAEGGDALPLLAFTLERLWTDRGADGTLRLAHYDAIGGVQGSLVAAVDVALSEPDRRPAIPARPDEQFVALRAAFIPWLARLDPDTGVVARRVARLDEIPAAGQPLIRRLIEARLLLTDRRNGTDVVEVAHESLLRRWPALLDWLRADGEDLKITAGVERAAAEWQRHDAQGAWLDHRAERLSAAERVARRPAFHGRLPSHALDYLSACRAHEDAEHHEREATRAEIGAAQAQSTQSRRLMRRSLLAALLAVAIGLGGWLWQRQRIETQVIEKVARQANTALRDGRTLSALRLAMEGARRLDGGSRASAVVAVHTALSETIMAAGWISPLAGHEDQVSSVAYSPDGGRILTGSWDRTAQVWDATSGQPIIVLRGHEAQVSCAAFSPDGKRIVTASYDGTARIWDADTGKLLTVLRGHERGVNSAVFSANGDRVVTASDDRTARVWETATGRLLAALRGHDSKVWSAAVSPDGLSIVTASADHTARIWDGAGGTARLVLRGEDEINRASFSPDGQLIITASDDRTARVWVAATGRKLAVMQGHENTVWSAAFSADGERVVTSSYDGTARVWQTTTGKEIAVLRGHEGAVFGAAFSPDGRTVVTGSGDQTARLWDVSPVRPAKAAGWVGPLTGHEDRIYDAQFSPNGQRILTASWDRTARIWDAATGQPLTVLRGHSGYVFSGAFSADSKYIVTASWDHTARVWDATTGKGLATLQHDDGLYGASFSPNGRRIVTASWDRTARLWDTNTGKLLATLRHDDGVYGAVFSPDGRRIVTASEDHTSRVWEAITGRPVTILRGHEDAIYTAVFDRDGKRVVTASRDRTARVWDATTGDAVSVLQGHENTVWTAAFSADGAQVVTASEDGTARIWQTATGEMLVILRGHEGAINGAAFSPDGSTVVTGSDDQTARLWDAATGETLATLRGHDAGVYTGTFSPDGQRVVTRAREKTAREWDVSMVRLTIPALQVMACGKLGGASTLTSEEMRLGNLAESDEAMDVCAGVR